MTETDLHLDAIRNLYDLGGSHTPSEEKGLLIIRENGDLVQPTDEEKTAIAAEVVRLQAEYDVLNYARARATAYPSLGDQMDMQYWDKINGTTTWQDAIAKVKSDNPKG